MLMCAAPHSGCDRIGPAMYNRPVGSAPWVCVARPLGEEQSEEHSQ